MSWAEVIYFASDATNETNLDLVGFSVNLFRMSDATKDARSLTDHEPMTELHEEGDQELWYAEGGVDGVAPWRFPLWIFWRVNPVSGAKYALVHPAVSPYTKQQLYLQAMFEVHTFWERTDRWLIKAELVGALLHKAPGVHPRRYYQWEEDGKKTVPMEIPPTLLPGVKQPDFASVGFGHERALISKISRARGIPTSVVKTVLTGLNEVAAEHMIDEGEPVDLGFVKLIAIPFRANWKEIICFRLGKLRLTKYLTGADKLGKGNRGDKEGRRHLSDHGFPELLCSPLNIGLKGARTGEGLRRLDYTIEAVPSKRFEIQIGAIESARKAPGGMNYVRAFEKRVEQLYDQIIEILQAYLKKVDLPFARISERGINGIPGFVETSGIYARAHNANFRRLPVHIIPPRTGFTAFADETDLCLLRPPTPQVPEVPDLQSEEDDVRDRIEPGVVEKLDDRPGGGDRVPLPPPNEVQNAGSGLLPLRETWSE